MHAHPVLRVVASTETNILPQSEGISTEAYLLFLPTGGVAMPCTPHKAA